jgi:hypothetical protein
MRMNRDGQRLDRVEDAGVEPDGVFDWRGLFQLCCVVMMAVALSALICRSELMEDLLNLRSPKLKPVMRASGGIQDAEGGKAILQKDRPEWILLGNSMLNSRVDTPSFLQLSGHSVYKLSFSGTKSAMWYLMLKTIVVESGVKPKCVSLFFRDRDLTRPTLRAEDNEEMIERLNGRDLPEWQLVMGDYESKRKSSWTRLTERVGMGVDELLPGEKLNVWARGKLEKRAYDVGSIGAGGGDNVWRSARNDVLSMEHMRKLENQASEESLEEMLAKAEEVERNQPSLFDASPEKSFLPHMVLLCEQHGIKFHLHRIKTNPDLPQLDAESAMVLREYLEQLRAYVEGKGCLYTDESGESGITGSMFLDSMHIRTEPSNQQAYMRIFWDQVKPIIDDVLNSDASAMKTHS